MLCTNSIFLMS